MCYYDEHILKIFLDCFQHFYKLLLGKIIRFFFLNLTIEHQLVQLN